MGPNGSGKSTLSYVLSGRDGYEVTGGEVASMARISSPWTRKSGHARAFSSAFNTRSRYRVCRDNFLKTAVNAVRRYRGESEFDAMQFVKFVRGKAKEFNMSDDMLKRSVNTGFSGGEKKRNEILQMAVLEPRLAISRRN